MGTPSLKEKGLSHGPGASPDWDDATISFSGGSPVSNDETGRPSSQSATRPTRRPETIITPRRVHESLSRTGQNLEGTSTAQQLATVKKKQTPISVTLLLRTNAVKTTENKPASTAASTMEPHNSATQ